MSLFHLRTLLMLAVMGVALALHYRIRSPRPRLFRLSAVLTALACAVELAGYASAMLRWNNVLVYNVFIALEFLLVLALVNAQQPNRKDGLLAIGGIGLAGFALNLGLVDMRQDMLFEGLVLIAFLLTIVLCAVLWRMANSSAVPLHRVPAFWLFTGMLLYFIALPPVVGLARYLREQDLELAGTLWTIMPVLAALRYLLAAYACWLMGGQQRSGHE